ncbi:FAD/NAD(P)-binding oxidoreductase [Echinicola jeungdonensis]|uniref:NAD(P)/FAD-dependent oxidoreductase n=1 Tax=Echinicola jeungdonensis TaxID=709343 RepID=A0ABV5J5M5_9BACT|nr:FAD/NAD(P)-binding oxidoreductase [Echinicola jeungdonensis]MDN3671022.1 FAD/NAD(P)-binding oxidoreductase [Echinicola jeungdonensis]
MEKENKNIVIIGNGISGITCARNIRKMDTKARIQVISGETPYFFSRTALMYIFMGHMKFENTKPYEDWFWDKNRIELIHDWVQSVDFQLKKLQLKNSPKLEYDVLVLATGSVPKTFGWPGQDLDGVQGLYSKQDLDIMEENAQRTKEAVIVGGGLIGIEMAEMLNSRSISVTILVREKGFWGNMLSLEESQLIERQIRNHHIKIKTATQLKAINPDEKGRVTSVETDKGEKIPCQFVGLATGVRPNVDWLKGSGLELNQGILVDEFFQTNKDGVYAIGDCVEFNDSPGKDGRRLEQVWYTGRIHGEILAYNLTHSPKSYQPGPWFNSAKFLDMEFQNYGWIPNKAVEGMKSFYWEHPNGRMAFKAVFDQNDFLKGINAFGLRLSHNYFDKALKENWTIDQTMAGIFKADFTPEFTGNILKDILDAYNLQFQKSIMPQKKKRIWERLWK